MTEDTMPIPHQGVHRRADSTQWQWCIKVPADLSGLYETKWAHRCSLKTADLREANHRAAQLRAQWLTTFDQQRKALSSESNVQLTPELARLVAQQTLHELLDSEDIRLDRATRRSVLSFYRHVGPIAMLGPAERLGLSVTQDSPGMTEGHWHYVKALEGPLNSPVAERPVSPAAAAAPLINPRVLRDVFDRWKVSKSRGPDSINRTEQVLAMYERETGNPPLASLKRDQGEAFRTSLMRQPGASKTKHDRLTALKTLLNYAVRELDWISRNPWEGLDIEYKTENMRKPWTDEQVRAFFTLPLFLHYALPVNRWKAGRAAAYWIPLLGLYTGARIGELCQLQTSDIITRDGAPFIRISGDGEGAQVKTDAANRDIPMHSELVRLGLLDYADCTRSSGSKRLWPDLKLRIGKPGGHFSAWFSEHRNSVDGGLPDFHSLRHTVRTKMTEAGIEEAVQDRITGHEVTGSEGTRVYSHPTVILRRAVETITYPGLNLPRVYKVKAEQSA